MMLRLCYARGEVRELLALIDTAKENRRWEFLIYQSAQREDRRKNQCEPQWEGEWRDIFVTCLI